MYVITYDTYVCDYIRHFSPLSWQGSDKKGKFASQPSWRGPLRMTAPPYEPVSKRRFSPPNLAPERLLAHIQAHFRPVFTPLDTLRRGNGLQNPEAPSSPRRPRAAAAALLRRRACEAPAFSSRPDPQRFVRRPPRRQTAGIDPKHAFPFGPGTEGMRHKRTLFHGKCLA